MKKYLISALIAFIGMFIFIVINKLTNFNISDFLIGSVVANLYWISITILNNKT